MNEINAILLSANTALVGVIVWLVKRQDKRELDQRLELQKLVRENNHVIDRVMDVLDRVEGLLKNWRGH